MLTGEFRSKVDALWNAFWTDGISTPLEIIEQILTIMLQRKFFQRVALVKGLRASQLAPLEELDGLFTTLEHRAFRGEL